MPQIYTRKSIRYSVTITEKTIVEDFKHVVNQNQKIKFSDKLQILAKKWDKIVYTFCILFNYLNYGICMTLFAPAMVDMKFLYRTSMASINYGNTFGSAGYLIGSLTGFLYKYINRQLSFIVCTVLLGVFVAVLPIWSQLWLFYVSMFLSGMGGGVWDSGNSVWVVEMWKDHSPPFFQLSQMMYGCGAIIGPLLVRLYIYGDLFNENDTIQTSITVSAAETATLPPILNPTTALFSNISGDDINYSVDRGSKLKVPFFIGGGLTLTIPIVLLVMFFVKRYQIPEKQTKTADKKFQSNLSVEENSINRSVEVSPKTRKILIALVAVSLNAYLGCEVVYFQYSSTYYQYLPIHLSAPTAAQVMSVMTATFTVGRGVSAFISSRVCAEVMLTYHMIILLISMAILDLGQHSEALIYTGNALIGFGFSAMWPAYFAFAEKYIQLTNKVASIFSFTAALFMLAAPLIIGPLIEEQPQIFLYLEMAMFCKVVILFIVIMVIVKRAQRFPVSYTIEK